MEWWFRRGRIWRKLPADPGRDDQAAEIYWTLRTAKSLTSTRPTMARLIKSYRLTPKFQTLKLSTRKVYEIRLRYVEEKNADVSVTSFRRSDIIAARDANAATPAAANQLIAVLSALFEHAINLDWRRDNPARGVDLLRGGEGHQPWTEGEIVRFRAVASGPVRTAFELCLGTGQRIGDVLAMSWDDVEDDEIHVIQQKTGAELWVPFTESLMSYLAQIPRGARTTIVTNAKGTPVPYNTLRSWMAPAMQAADIQGKTFHGLRKNATIELIEAGCSEDHVMAITGHASSEMVRLYGRGVRQRKLARAARRKAGT